MAVVLVASFLLGFFVLGRIQQNGPALGGWDAYPFGLLTMAVSLEAIILSVFVLLSQNRQVARDRVRNDIEYGVNVKAELQIAHMHEKVDNMYAAILARLDRDQATRPPKAEKAQKD